jgi:hypothetical protein
MRQRNTVAERVAAEIEHWKARATDAERRVRQLRERRENEAHDRWVRDQIAADQRRRAQRDDLTNSILASLRGER